MSKFHNIKTNGYDSKKEAKRAQELKLLQLAGQITGLQEKTRFVLIPKQEGERECVYESDFEYFEGPGKLRVVEDVKGVKTPAYRIKKKLLLHVHGIRIRET